ncbi:MAG: MFS transporter [Elusimicrobia bacterium CG08_land_8_20_14_0_20_51_18]|nr:MAG: MFS transporter [Elusimicrobia bacterium CG08_land_8_20_14_0_20_51_18]
MKIIEDLKKNLGKNIIFLGVVSGLTDISSEMLYPVIPVFLTSVLNAPMSVVGLIEGIAESTASVLKIAGGWWSDKISKRKPFVVGGYALSALAKPLMALAFSWHFVLLARFIDRVGKGVRTSARDALISSSTGKEHWGKAFGFHRAMDTLGAAVGPLVALLLFKLLGDGAYRQIFLIAFIPAVLGVLVLVYFVKESAPVEKKEDKTAVEIKELSGDFKIFTALYLIFALGNSSDAFLILRTKSLGFTMGGVILVYFGYNIIYAILATPAGYIADRFGKINSLVFGLAVFSLVYLGFAKNESKSAVWLLFAAYGFYGAFSEGIYKAIISHLSPSEKRATAMGLFQGLLGFMLFFSSFLAGILWEKYGAPAPFFIGSTTAIISAISIFFWSRLKGIKI